MADKFQNKYRIASTRLQHWDYGWTAACFVTICTKNRVSFFGEVKEGKMQLSHVGIIADICWHEIKQHAENIELDVFVVMPNHVHGILILNGSLPDVMVETRHALSLPSPSPSQSSAPPEKSIGQKRFQNQGKNTLSSIIGGYKSAMTKHSHRLGFDFAWQVSFHDHVIQDEQSLFRIQNYILNNPGNWDQDKFYRP
jgi:REP element-mobilizing transposase RayT